MRAALLRARIRAWMLLLLMLAAVTTAGVPAARAADGGSYAEIDRYAAAQRERADVPGTALAVVDRDKGLVHSRTWGSDGNGAPITTRTPFLLGSLAKPFTALAVMQLVEAGKVGLDDPVRRHLPWFRPTGITVRHLLNQSSGLSQDDGFAQSDRFDNAPGGIQRVARGLADVTPVAPPGRRHEYSDANYMLLGALVETVSGRTFSDRMHETVFGPLGMTGAITDADDAERTGLAPGHRYVFGKPWRHSVPFDTSGTPYGYLGATLDDLVPFARAQLGGGAASSVLSPAGFRQMHTGTVPVRTSHHYGLGWRDDRFDDLGTRVVWHGGATTDHQGTIVLAPDRGLAVILLHNAYAAYKDEFFIRTGLNAMRVLLGGEPEAVSDDPMFGRLLTALSLTTAVLTVATGWSLYRLVRPRRDAFGTRRRILIRSAAAVLVCLLLAATAFLFLPGLLAIDLGQVLLFTPDAGYLLVTAGSLALALAALRGLVAFQAMRRSAARGRN
ncbi:serine hydrolase domain-containing protein [Streptomyces sp. NPDC048370]|uniref:serine hydrolase domain-containing protein n=1 Tax=Streptomyces sp. NPDC048370 TaxID=3365540 RepID=UPI00371643B7